MFLALFSPQRQREELAKFLEEQPAFKNELIKQLAQAQLAKIHSLQQEQTNENIDFYIAAHLDELEQKAQKAIQDTCKQIIPERDYAFILKHIGLFACVLFPAALVLVELLFCEGQTFSKARLVVALGLLVCLFIASAVSLISEAYRKQ